MASKKAQLAALLGQARVGLNQYLTAVDKIKRTNWGDEVLAGHHLSNLSDGRERVAAERAYVVGVIVDPTDKSDL